MRRRDIVAAAAGAVVATVLAGSVAWAAIPGEGGVYTACMLKNVGTVRLIDKSLPASNLMSKCTALEVAISWNQLGQPGRPGQDGSAGAAGVSPTVAQLAVGDANCPAGGAALTGSGSSTAYVCNGQDGADGSSSSGTITSPNGEYALSVTDDGIELSHGPTVSIRLSDNDVFVRGRGVELRADLSATLKGATDVTVEGGTAAALRTTGVATVQGSLVQIKAGGSCLPAAREGDTVAVSGPGSAHISTGSPVVCIG